MITVNEVTCTFATETPEYPSIYNGQTFSIENGFEFTIQVTVSELGAEETVTFGLIQFITQSMRKIGNATSGNQITFPDFPQLDGDPGDYLWYSLTTSLIAGNGVHTITLNDNPSTNCQSCVGSPTCVNVTEDFKIILATLEEEADNKEYTSSNQWGWGYNCRANKNAAGTWDDVTAPVLYFNEDAAVTIDVNTFDPQQRANTAYVTTEQVGCA